MTGKDETHVVTRTYQLILSKGNGKFSLLESSRKDLANSME